MKHFLQKPFTRLLALFLAAVLAIDSLQLVRLSGLSALACLPTLLRDVTAPGDVVVQHREAILQQAQANALPAALVAALIYDHQQQLTRSRAFTDCAGSALGADLSLGPAQVRLSTAAQLDGESLAELSALDFRALRARLLAPASNIGYEVRELRALLDRDSRFPGISAAGLLNNPAALALVITEYRSGRRETGVAESRIGANALRTLNLMHESTLAEFAEPGDDLENIRATLRTYVDNIACETAKFNRACERNGGRLPSTR